MCQDSVWRRPLSNNTTLALKIEFNRIVVCVFRLRCQRMVLFALEEGKETTTLEDLWVRILRIMPANPFCTRQHGGYVKPTRVMCPLASGGA